MAEKLSKKNQDPNQVEKDKIALLGILTKKSQHFLVGTRVVSNGLGGTISKISKDGGTKLIVEWDNDTQSIIDNPRQRR